MWEGPERRSGQSVLARSLVAAKAKAANFEDELRQTPRHRFRRRSHLEHAIEDARQQEQSLLSALGGGPDANEM